MDAFDVMTVTGRLNDSAVSNQLAMILNQFPRPWAFDEKQNILDKERKLIPPLVVNCANMLIEIQGYRISSGEMLTCFGCKRALPRTQFYRDPTRRKRKCMYQCKECVKSGVMKWRSKNG